MAVWIARPGASVPKAIAEEIGILLDHSARLEQFIELANRRPVALAPTEVIASISNDVGVSADVLRKIFNALENLANLSEEFGSSIGPLMN
jgi:hypothetical protein